MDRLVEGQEMGVRQQQSLEDPLSSLKSLPPSKSEGELLRAPMRQRQLSWNQDYPGHPPTPTILQSPYYFAGTVSPCVKLSFHPILEHCQSTIPSTLYCLPFSLNRSLAILPLQVTIQLTKQPKTPPPFPQTQFFLFLSLVSFTLSTKQFATLYQHTNALLQYTNIEGFSVMKKRSKTKKMTFSLMVYNLVISLLSGNTSTNLIYLKIQSA